MYPFLSMLWVTVIKGTRGRMYFHLPQGYGIGKVSGDIVTIVYWFMGIFLLRLGFEGVALLHRIRRDIAAIEGIRRLREGSEG